MLETRIFERCEVIVEQLADLGDYAHGKVFFKVRKHMFFSKWVAFEVPLGLGIDTTANVDKVAHYMYTVRRKKQTMKSII